MKNNWIPKPKTKKPKKASRQRWIVFRFDENKNLIHPFIVRQDNPPVDRKTILLNKKRKR